MDQILLSLGLILGILVFLGSSYALIRYRINFNIKHLAWALFIVSSVSLTVTSIFIRPQTMTTLLADAPMRTVGTKDKLKDLIEESQGYYYWDFTGGVPTMEDNQSDGGITERDFIGTNNQVEGVEEGDIVKTDGNRIYYSSYYENKVYVIDVDLQNAVSVAAELELGNVYTEALYLTDEYLIVIGYRYDLNQYGCGGIAEDADRVASCIGYYAWQPTGTVVAIDTTTLETVYTLETDFSFMDHRVIDQSIFLVGNRYMYSTTEDFRPHFTEQVAEQDATESWVGYDQLYYFEGTPVYTMTMMTGILLNSDPSLIEFHSEGYLGSGVDWKKMYVSPTAMYLSQTVYHYTENSSHRTMTITKFDIDAATASITYRASGSVQGGALNQFSMDEFGPYLRVATTDVQDSWVSVVGSAWTWDWSRNVTNYLYVLEEDVDATFKLVGLLDEGLGKPNESIQSVRFNGERAYIVTFLRTDPLYIVDLSIPSQPAILDDIEIKGFDTYQHVWGDNQLIGLGFAGDESGNITGMKITAYDTTPGSAHEIETFEFASNQTVELDGYDYTYYYAYGEALYNHKALLVSPSHGLLGFGVTAYAYGYRQIEVSTSETPDGEPSTDTEYSYEWTYTYESYYALFKIDFESGDVIGDPILIQHPTSDMYYVTVDRGIYIDGVVHTLSNQRIISYDIANDLIIGDYVLFDPSTL